MRRRTVHPNVSKKLVREVRRLEWRTKLTLFIWRRYLDSRGAVAVGRSASATGGPGCVAIGNQVENPWPWSLVIHGWPEMAVKEALEFGMSKGPAKS